MAEEQAKATEATAASTSTAEQKTAQPSMSDKLKSWGAKAQQAGKDLSEKAKERVKMEGLLKQAHESLLFFLSPELEFEKQIPTELFKSCKGIVMMTVIKAGFGVGAAGGTGIVLAKGEKGWSGPMALASAGINWGLQIGASKVDYLMILNDNESVETFMGKGEVKLGGDVNVSVGPKGRDASVGIAASNELKLAPIVSYSMAKGAYVGVTLKGEVLGVRNDCNEAFYGNKVTAKQILSSEAEAKENADLTAIRAMLDTYAKGESYKAKPKAGEGSG